MNEKKMKEIVDANPIATLGGPIEAIRSYSLQRRIGEGGKKDLKRIIVIETDERFLVHSIVLDSDICSGHMEPNISDDLRKAFEEKFFNSIGKILSRYECINCGHVGLKEDDVTSQEPDFWGSYNHGYTCTRCDYVHYPRDGEMMENVNV